MVSSEFRVPHNNNKAAKYTNCAMLEELKRSPQMNCASGFNSFRNWFPDGMCSAFKMLFLMPWNVISCRSRHRR